MNNHGELAHGLLGPVLPKAPLWGHATVGDGVHKVEGMSLYTLMVVVSIQRRYEIFPATLNLRNRIFSSYPRQGIHFRCQVGIFQKIPILPKSWVYISNWSKGTQICNYTPFAGVAGTFRYSWLARVALPQCQTFNFGTWFTQENDKGFPNNFVGILGILWSSCPRNMSAIRKVVPIY